MAQCWPLQEGSSELRNQPVLQPPPSRGHSSKGSSLAVSDWQSQTAASCAQRGRCGLAKRVGSQAQGDGERPGEEQGSETENGEEGTQRQTQTQGQRQGETGDRNAPRDAHRKRSLGKPSSSSRQPHSTEGCVHSAGKKDLLTVLRTE